MNFDEQPDAPLHGECAEEIARLERELAEAKREIDYLRRYGNKDCTAMADAAMKEKLK